MSNCLLNYDIIIFPRDPKNNCQPSGYKIRISGTVYTTMLAAVTSTIVLAKKYNFIIAINYLKNVKFNISYQHYTPQYSITITIFEKKTYIDGLNI